MPRLEEVACPDQRLIGGELPGNVHQSRDRRGGQHGSTLNEDEMQAHAQAREPPGSAHRVTHRGTCDHQAGGGEDSVAVRAFNGLVDGLGKAEIVGGDNGAAGHAALLRSRRKWKNSTPSRSRRFIICGLRTISPTIAAILGARK